MAACDDNRRPEGASLERRCSSTRRKTACHELGHVFGLEHRRSGRTCMRDDFATLYGC
jgi:predicted Zn-dependent protease